MNILKNKNCNIKINDEEIPIELYKKENGEFIKFVRYEEINKKEAMYDSLAVDYRLAQEEIERLKEQLNDEIQEELKQSEIMVKKQQEIERLNNIIKEVREEIEYFELQAKHLDDNIYLDEKLTNKLLEILDKEKDNE